MIKLSRYLITDPLFYTHDEPHFSRTLTDAFIKCTPDFACFRDKSDFCGKMDLAKIFIDKCHEFSVKPVINSDMLTAIRLGCEYVHLTSVMLDDIDAAKSQGLKVFASCHDIEEAKKCESGGADFITLSPVFSSPSKGRPLGVEKFSEMIKSLEIKVFALGGIVSDEDVKLIEESGAYGFASIRYFVD